MKKKFLGVIGSGTMGSGIAQLAATHNWDIVVLDKDPTQIKTAESKIYSGLEKLKEKGKITAEAIENITQKIKYSQDISELADCSIVIEAIIEDISIKKKLFAELESVVSKECILATNTSSLSVASISAACKLPERFLGIHFFNPAHIMPLVEIVSSISTDSAIAKTARGIVDSWGKCTVEAKDTPGFIVNRVARPFYGEALRIYDEGIADIPTIDWAIKELGGFRMGPFELMDFIGNDVNYKVTEAVFEQFYYDPRYKPSLTQKRLFESGRFGRKSGRGYYNYAEGASNPEAKKDFKLGEIILHRILTMLINEAIDAVYLGIASAQDIELAMTKGVNYPKGLLAWCEEIGADRILENMQNLSRTYQEDRYRPSLMLKEMAQKKSAIADRL